MDLSALQPGERLLERYEIEATLGEGSFGVVYRARQLSTGQLVAIKMLLRQKASSSQQLAEYDRRFKREIELIAKLRGPHSIQLIDSGFIDGCPFMVLEFVEGETLDSVLSRGPLPPRLVRRLFGHILEAVAEAHDHGIVHRDLKPANLIITGRGRRLSAKVLDFGIAGIEANFRNSKHTSITRVGKIWGSPQYMAPEQFRQFSSPRVESDIYALGLIMLECLQSYPAVRGAEMTKIIAKQLHDPVHIPAEIRGSAYGPLIARACSKNPEERYSSADEMLAALEQLELSHTGMRRAGTQPLEGHLEPRYDTSDLSPERPESSPRHPRPGTLPLPAEASPAPVGIDAARAVLAQGWSVSGGTRQFDVEERAEHVSADQTTGVEIAADAELGDTLESILALSEQAASWDAALELLESRVEGEPRAEKRALIHYAIALICYENFADEERALAACTAALDSDPREIRALHAIDRILSLRQDFAALAQQLDQHISRVLALSDLSSEDELLLLDLYTELGELYRSRLGDWEHAIHAFLHARTYAPDDERITRSLIELYQYSGDQDPQAIELLQRLIHSTTQPAAQDIRTLYQLYLRVHDYDAAWCIADVLSYLGQVSQDEQRFYDQYRTPTRPQAQLTHELRLHLESDVSHELSAIFGILYFAAAHLFSWELAHDWQLSDANRLDDPGHSPLAELMVYHTWTLAPELEPALYVRSDPDLELRHSNTLPPALIAGTGLLQNPHEPDLSFALARYLTTARPERIMAMLGLPQETLSFYLYGAFISCFPEAYPNIDPAYTPLLEALSDLPPETLEALEAHCYTLLEQGTPPEQQLDHWLRDVERAALRTAFILAGDLHTALRTLRSPSTAPLHLSFAEAELALLQLALSETYFELRAHLGLTIG